MRLAEQRVAADAIDAHQLRVAARDEQRDERKVGPRIGEQRREQVALEVMDADHGLAERDARGPTATEAPTSSAPPSPGPSREGDEVHVIHAPRSAAFSTRATPAAAARRTWSREASSGTTPP